MTLRTLRPKVTVLVCTLNEAPNLPHVLPAIPEWVDEILLVDGHSTDSTVEVAKHLRPEIRVVYQPSRGKGDALRYGVQEARGDIVVTLDADGETNPVEIDRFVAPLLDGYDFVKGSRLGYGRPRRMPRYRWLGNKILAMTFNVLFGTGYGDICSGYNAFWKRAFSEVSLTSRGFEMEQELWARVHKVGMKVREVNHHSEGRIAGASKISSIRQGLIDWCALFRERFRD